MDLHHPRPLDATLSVTRAAEVLGVHANTVRAWSDAGRLRYYRINPRGDRRYRHGRPPALPGRPRRDRRRRSWPSADAPRAPPCAARALDGARRRRSSEHQATLELVGELSAISGSAIRDALASPGAPLDAAVRTICDALGVVHASAWRLDDAPPRPGRSRRTATGAGLVQLPSDVRRPGRGPRGPVERRRVGPGTTSRSRTSRAARSPPPSRATSSRGACCSSSDADPEPLDRVRAGAAPRRGDRRRQHRPRRRVRRGRRPPAPARGRAAPRHERHRQPAGPRRDPRARGRPRGRAVRGGPGRGIPASRRTGTAADGRVARPVAARGSTRSRPSRARPWAPRRSPRAGRCSPSTTPTTHASATSAPPSSRRASTRRASRRCSTATTPSRSGSSASYHDRPHPWTEDELDTMAALATQATRRDQGGPRTTPSSRPGRPSSSRSRPSVPG